MVLGTLERLILLQIGAAAATRERVQDVVDSLIQQGRMEREEGRMVVDDVMARARERSHGARALLAASLQQGLRTAGVPDREAYEDLLFRVEQLEHRIRLLENPPSGTSRSQQGPQAPTEAPDTPVAAVPPAGSAAPEPPMGDVVRPPSDEPGSTPGSMPRG